jgi:hypothetical protein
VDLSPGDHAYTTSRIRIVEDRPLTPTRARQRAKEREISDGAKLWFSSGDGRDSLAGRFGPPVPLTSALNFALVRNPADIGRVTSITLLDGNSFGVTGPIENGFVVSMTGDFNGTFVVGILAKAASARTNLANGDS